MLKPNYVLSTTCCPMVGSDDKAECCSGYSTRLGIVMIVKKCQHVDIDFATKPLQMTCTYNGENAVADGGETGGTK